MILLTILVVALAAHRLARAVAVDTISDRLRDVVYARAFTQPDPRPFPDGAKDEHDARLEGWEPAPPARVKSRVWSWMYGLVSCPHCCGWWLSLALWWAWAGYEWTRQWWITAAAVAGAQSIMSAKGSD